MQHIQVNPIHQVEGQVTVPGDKSISHRAVLFGALADGEVVIDNFLMGEDTLHTVELVKDLGVSVQTNHSGCQIRVKGQGIESFKESTKILDVGNAGTLIRIGAGLLAACPFFSIITGDESICQRPMGRVVEPLIKMGAQILGRKDTTLAPLAITGGRLKGITHISTTASAQVKSAILLAGLLAEEGETVVKEPALSRDHTERMLHYLGADLRREGLSVAIRPQRKLQARSIYVPGDISSAAFVMALAILKTSSEVIISNIGYNPSRIGVIQALQLMGAQLEIFNHKELNGEPVADLRILPSALNHVQLSGNIIPNIIDEIPILAVLATQATGRTIISDALELRVKESDRISTTVAGLRSLGASIEERPDGMVIDGPVKLTGGVVESHGDHRIAMAMVIAGLCASDQVIVKDTDCINTSFPSFVERLNTLIGYNHLQQSETSQETPDMFSTGYIP